MICGIILLPPPCSILGSTYTEADQKPLHQVCITAHGLRPTGELFKNPNLIAYVHRASLPP